MPTELSWSHFQELIEIIKDEKELYELYFHLGYRDYIKTLIEYEPSRDKEEDVIIFYKKKIRE